MVCYLAMYWAFYLMHLWLSLYKKNSVAFATETSVYPKDLVVYIYIASEHYAIYFMATEFSLF